MRAVVETEWRELVHKLPPKSPQRYGTIRPSRKHKEAGNPAGATVPRII